MLDKTLSDLSKRYGLFSPVTRSATFKDAKVVWIPPHPRKYAITLVLRKGGTLTILTEDPCMKLARRAVIFGADPLNATCLAVDRNGVALYPIAVLRAVSGLTKTPYAELLSERDALAERVKQAALKKSDEEALSDLKYEAARFGYDLIKFN